MYKILEQGQIVFFDQKAFDSVPHLLIAQTQGYKVTSNKCVMVSIKQTTTHVSKREKISSSVCSPARVCFRPTALSHIYYTCIYMYKYISMTYHYNMLHSHNPKCILVTTYREFSVDDDFMTFGTNICSYYHKRL